MQAMFHGCVPLLASLPVLLAPLAAQELQGYAFEVTTLGGQKLTSEQLQASLVIVDYWGTWCPPCREAVPVLENLYRQYKHYGLEIVGLCYEGGATADVAADKVRKFAAKHGMTYPLAIGTPELQAKVPGFSAYPTMLLFDRGFAHHKTLVGFGPNESKQLEQWVRDRLGIEAQPAPEPQPPAADGEREEVEEPPPAARELPEGVIFKPGDGDKGFTFKAVDAAGAEFDFTALRGKPVLLAITSTWDGEAKRTAAFLQRLHGEHGAKAHVVAASMELSRQDAARLEAIRRFRDETKTDYRVFPAGLGLTKKIHMYSGMPTYLLFSADLTLVRRDDGNSDSVFDGIAAQLGELVRG
jgi:thiol-disulfide isomerase/thioredoxin